LPTRDKGIELDTPTQIPFETTSLYPLSQPSSPNTPTYVPTIAVIKRYLVVQSISGITVQKANTEEFMNAFKTITATSFGPGVTMTNININKITAISGRRTLLQSDPLGVSVAYVLTATNSDVATLRANINSAISSGAFTAAMVNNGYPAAVSSDQVILLDITDATNPTSNPTTHPKVLSVGGIAGVVIGGFFFIFFLAMSMYFLCFRRKNGSKDAPVYPIDGQDGGHSLGDFKDSDGEVFYGSNPMYTNRLEGLGPYPNRLEGGEDNTRGTEDNHLHCIFFCYLNFCGFLTEFMNLILYTHMMSMRVYVPFVVLLHFIAVN
jgi:hypothetical protein